MLTEMHDGTQVENKQGTEETENTNTSSKLHPHTVLL